MDKYEILFAIIDSIIAFIGLVFIVFGWIIPNRQDKRKLKLQKEQELDMEKIKWRKEQVDNQISKLYGPIYALIIEEDILFSRILYQLGRKFIFHKDKSFNEMPENEQLIWSHYVNTYKIPYQLKMASILRDNIHLIYNSEIPICYQQFLDYTLGWELLDNQKTNNVPNFYEYHYCFNYPREFNEYIKTTLEILLDEQVSLIKLTNSDKKVNLNKNGFKKISIKTPTNESIYEPEEKYIISVDQSINDNTPRLISILTNKTIYINKPIFYIGRKPELSDLYIKNHLVNYNHAYIITKDNSCFLIDNNSLNGTYINGDKVKHNSEHLLKNNDIIAIANEKFIFSY